MGRMTMNMVGLLGMAGTLLGASDWPAFRGPHGTGASDARNVPIHWGPDRNIKWKAPLPGPGNGSPVALGTQVFVTCSPQGSQGKVRSLFCFDRQTGAQRWVRTVEFDKVMPTHKTSPYCATTPAVAPDRLVVWHGSAGLFCYDLEGKELWKRELGEFRHMWGYAASPILHEGKVLLNCGPGTRVYMTAIDLATGRTLWETEEPTDGNGEKRKDGSPMGSWATPVIAKVDGRDQVICSMPTRVNGYDPLTGEILWYCEGLRGNRGDLAYSSAVIGNGLCVAIGGYSGPGLALRLGGSGNVTDTHRLWRNAQNPQSIGSGLMIGDHFYRPNASGAGLECLDPRTGKSLWSERAAGSNWGSMVLADGRIYVTSQSGTTVVFAPKPERYEEIAINELGESSNATPAVCDGQIFLRTDGHLFCIEER